MYYIKYPPAHVNSIRGCSFEIRFRFINILKYILEYAIKRQILQP